MDMPTHISSVLFGVGLGILIVSNLVSFHSALAYAQLVMSGIGLVLMVAGAMLGIYNYSAFVHEVVKPTIRTELEPGEEILKVLPGGRRIAGVTASMGTWCITNRRLIYEESAFTGEQRSSRSFPLKNMVSLEIIKAGRFTKYLEATFTRERVGKPEYHVRVQILVKKLEDFRDILKKASSNVL